MKKFKFRLEGLLKIKRALERETQYELMEAQHLVDRQEKLVKDANQKIEDWSAYYDHILKTSGNAEYLGIIDKHMQKLYRYREQLNISLDVLKRKKEDIVMQYNEIKKEVKTLEHLEEKKRLEHQEEMMKLEANLNDEMAMMRYARERSAV
ncbi:MAG: flagellar FliJ family protein [Deltaproteobacteria bacterium]|nr:flagellar FliJ family protein [Deltaproteobacteria bacterium]